jgi:hypothetical protein
MPKPVEETIAAFPFWKWHPGPITDRIDMEFVLEELEAGVRTELIANRLETGAAVHQNIADGARKAAEILSRAKPAGRKTK